MRIKIIKEPTGEIAGVALGHFRAGGIYDIGIQVANVFVAEGWAEFVPGNDADKPAQSLAEGADQRSVRNAKR